MTTSSAPNRTFRTAGPSMVSAPAIAPARITRVTINTGGPDIAPVPTATAATRRHRADLPGRYSRGVLERRRRRQGRSKSGALPASASLRPRRRIRPAPLNIRDVGIKYRCAGRGDRNCCQHQRQQSGGDPHGKGPEAGDILARFRTGSCSGPFDVVVPGHHETDPGSVGVFCRSGVKNFTVVDDDQPVGDRE